MVDRSTPRRQVLDQYPLSVRSSTSTPFAANSQKAATFHTQTLTTLAFYGMNIVRSVLDRVTIMNYRDEHGDDEQDWRKAYPFPLRAEENPYVGLAKEAADRSIPERSCGRDETPLPTKPLESTFSRSTFRSAGGTLSGITARSIDVDVDVSPRQFRNKLVRVDRDLLRGRSACENVAAGHHLSDDRRRESRGPHHGGEAGGCVEAVDDVVSQSGVWSL